MFDYDAARKAGYSHREIVDFLSKRKNFDYAGAINEGYGEDEILDFLLKDENRELYSALEQPAKQVAPAPEPVSVHDVRTTDYPQMEQPKGWFKPKDMPEMEQKIGQNSISEQQDLSTVDGLIGLDTSRTSSDELVEAFNAEDKDMPERSLAETAKDLAITGLKGAIGVGEAIQGLIDIPTAGRFGYLTEKLGYKPREAKEILDTFYSDAQKYANEKAQGAEGFAGTIKAMLKYPSTIAHTTVESLPLMGAGGVLGRGLVGVAPKVAPWVAGAFGEGAVGAGLAAEDIRQQSGGLLTPKQSAIAAVSGAGTGIFNLVGGRLANKLGFADIDTMLVAGGAKSTSGGIAKKIIGGGISEGAFEELPQSAQEQIWQNAALDKPLLEGVPQGAAMGLMVGGVTGAGANLATGVIPKIDDTPIDNSKNILESESLDEAIGEFAKGNKPVGKQPAEGVGEQPQMPVAEPIEGVAKPSLKPVGQEVQNEQRINPVQSPEDLVSQPQRTEAAEAPEAVAPQIPGPVERGPEGAAAVEGRAPERGRGDEPVEVPALERSSGNEVSGQTPPEPPPQQLSPEGEEGATELSRFEVGREIVYNLPRESSALKPTKDELKAAADKVGVSVAEARRALDLYNHGGDASGIKNAKVKIKPADLPREEPVTEPSKPAAPAKEPWQMTLAEYREFLNPDDPHGWADDVADVPYDLDEEAHKEAIEKALSEGKRVPAEVLKDYPDIVEKFERQVDEWKLMHLENNDGIKYKKIEKESSDKFIKDLERKGAAVGNQGASFKIVENASGSFDVQWEMDGKRTTHGAERPQTHPWTMERARKEAAKINDELKVSEKKEPGSKISELIDEYGKKVDNIDLLKGSAEPEQPAIIEHTTKRGKVIRGIIRTDLDKAQAKAIDPFTFKKDGGWFIREKHLGESAPSASAKEPASAPQGATKPRPLEKIHIRQKAVIEETGEEVDLIETADLALKRHDDLIEKFYRVRGCLES